MFNNKSRTGVGMAVFTITGILSLFGFDVEEGQVTEAVISVLNLASFVLMIWGQVDRKDLVWGLWRK